MKTEAEFSLPLAGGDESFVDGFFKVFRQVCPSREGMNHITKRLNDLGACLPLVGGDDSIYRKSTLLHMSFALAGGD